MLIRLFMAVLLAVVLPACGQLQRQRAAPLTHATAQSLYGTLTQAVVRLETRQQFDEQTFVDSPVGTGFLVELSDELFLVTARHVAEATEEARVRDALSTLEFVIPRSAWVFHPAASGRQQRHGGEWITVDPVDVAVARLPWPEDARLQPLLYCPGACQGRRGQLAAADPEPLQPVVAAGYPSYLTFELRRQLPLVRAGTVAMAASEPVLKDLGGKTYLEARVRAIDLRTFPGDSGSPVFEGTDLEEGLRLVGMILGGDAELDFAIAEPVSRVIETLELAARTPAPAGRVRVERLPAAAASSTH
jgi:hypothetical protein